MEQKNTNDSQTWDLSYRTKANLDSERESEFLNYPKVLDLSCKNPVSPVTTSTNTTACLSQSSPADTNKQHQHSSLSDVEKQSSFANSMLLSSSELKSLMQMTEKCESYNSIGGKINESLQQLVPSSTVTMEVPTLSPPHLSMHLNNQTITIPTTTSTITSTSTSYVSTSLQTNDETSKNLLNFMPEPSAQIAMFPAAFDAIKKTARPFKAYTNDTLLINRSREIVDPMLNHESKKNYLQFRAKMLESVKKINLPNPKMRRTIRSPGEPTSTADEKTAAYYERRRKNNEAAKRSRDARRAKEDELAIWATFLQEENAMLKSQLTRSYYLLQQEGYNINHLMTYNLI
ncbi:protein giant [Nylanderia fulva]|uniref:protein giant n=1 Tax=Nylanderia fulva TaxID=613905 RepID=UPI0010FAD30A|nr:protein giant [Nylanderia fulva]